ncbi:hypothetical protein F7P09_28110 (plasmid) [Klebsiella pneumoniae]|nr:hypothetical protein F7P09_28110 [Klebsiella pneumoniae]
MIEPAVLAAVERQGEAPSERGSTRGTKLINSAYAQCLKNHLPSGLSTYPRAYFYKVLFYSFSLFYIF